jgi:tRNA pseudouridine13 synthase
MSSAKERIFQKFKEIEERNPAFVIRNDPQFSEEDLKKIGITHFGPRVVPGYIKLYPEDFVVEEVTLKGQFCTIETSPDSIQVNSPKKDGHFFVQATVIKKDLSTLDAQESMAQALKLPLNVVNFAGIKDSVAISSQRFSFDTQKIEEIEGLQLENIYLKDIARARGRVFVGQLLGNRFSILVRTKEGFDEALLQKAIDEVSSQGFPNFYNLQRFGPRLITHQIGKRIIQRDYEGTIKFFLSQTSPYEIPYINLLRTKIGAAWPNFDQIFEIMNEIPDYFGHEIALVKVLKESKGDFVKALSRNERLTSIYYSAYVSYLFNQALSEKLASGEVESELPLLSNDAKALEFYDKYLKKDGLSGDKISVPELPFIDNIIKPRVFLSLVKPPDLKYEVVPEGVVISFILPKAAYATSLLSYIFELYEGFPTPPWVDNSLRENIKRLLPQLATKFKPEELSENEETETS